MGAGLEGLSGGGLPTCPPPASVHQRLADQYKILYIQVLKDLKPVEFRGNSLDGLRVFPLGARRDAGHQIDQVQNGQEPDDWKPMNTVDALVNMATAAGMRVELRVPEVT